MSVFRLTNYAKIKGLCDKIDSAIENVGKFCDAEQKKNEELKRTTYTPLLQKYGLTDDLVRTAYGTKKFPYIANKEDYYLIGEYHRLLIRNTNKVNKFYFEASCDGDGDNFELTWINPCFSKWSDIATSKDFEASPKQLREIFGEIVQVKVVRDYPMKTRMSVYSIDFS